MKVLTTAIDKGLHKPSDCTHKLTLWALAPGVALRLSPEPREVVKITEAEARRAKYAYLLSWVEGRTVAQFTLDGSTLAQPTQPDPIPKKRRSDEADHQGDVERTDVVGSGVPRRARAALVLEESGEYTGGGAHPAGARSADQKVAGRGRALGKKKRSFRRPLKPLDLL